MNFSELLSVGSVVRLAGATKKILIIGIMPIKEVNDDEVRAFEYLGVPYPEGYVGKNSALMFNGSKIEEVVFTGYSNEERDFYNNFLQKILDAGEAAVQQKSLGVKSPEDIF